MGRTPNNREKIHGVRLWKRTGETARAKWKLTYRDPGTGKDVTIATSTDYELAIEKAKQIKARIDRITQGLAQPQQERWLEHDQTPLPKHLDEYQRSLKDAGCDPKHVRQMSLYARAVLLGTPPAARVSLKAKRKRGQRISINTVRLQSPRWHRVSALTVTGIRQQIGRVKDQRSAATANRYLDATRAFLAWGIQDQRWGENPALSVRRFNAQTDRRVVRRVISPGEFARLLETAEVEGSPVRSGLTGKERGLVYRLCLATGLRRKEIRRLLVHHLRLTIARPGIQLPASLAKNRKGTFIPISIPMADALAKAIEGLEPDETALRVPANTARMLRGDLAAAGIPYRTHEGVFDFHAIRHESGALLVSAGVNVKAVQAHMRHSRATLTLDTYGHLMPDDRDSTLKSLPDFGHGEAQRNAQRSSVNDSLSESPNVRDEVEKQPRNEWSDGESNPDLLNAIQPLNQANLNPLVSCSTSENNRAAQCAAPGRYFMFRGRIQQRIPRQLKKQPEGAVRHA